MHDNALYTIIYITNTIQNILTGPRSFPFTDSGPIFREKSETSELKPKTITKNQHNLPNKYFRQSDVNK